MLRRKIKIFGIVLISIYLADVSDEDFWSAICADIENYDFRDYDARYFASNILILGRIFLSRKKKEYCQNMRAGFG